MSLITRFSGIYVFTEKTSVKNGLQLSNLTEREEREKEGETSIGNVDGRKERKVRSFM